MRVKGLSSIFGDRIAVAHADPRAYTTSPFTIEQRHVAQARDIRRREFFAGRACARTAMKMLGLPAMAVPVAQDRAPVWPTGLVGSISHCETLCVAAVARADDGYLSIGLDIEPAQDLPDDILDTVCTIAEIEWLARQPLARRGLLARLIFSAKECTYKCQYPLTRRLVDFHAFEVDVHEETFTATFMMSVGQFRPGDRLTGRFLLSDGYIACAMALKDEAPRQGHARELSECA
jgi:4'-phosphopantetheinyl transferase EntD